MASVAGFWYVLLFWHYIFMADCSRLKWKHNLKVKSCVLFGEHSEDLCALSRVWFFATPWTVAHQAPLSLGIPRQEHWSGLPYPPPEDLPDSGIEPESPACPALQADSLPTEPPGKPCLYRINLLSKQVGICVLHLLWNKYWKSVFNWCPAYKWKKGHFLT